MGDFETDVCNYLMSKVCSECGGNHKSYQCDKTNELKLIRLYDGYPTVEITEDGKQVWIDDHLAWEREEG